jgi:hypothetical protein
MSNFIQAFKISLRRPTFLVVFVVLLAGAIGLNAATSALKLRFRKEAMSLRKKEGLTALPAQLGTWLEVPEPQTINPDQAHELGTDQYVFRNYVNIGAGPAGVPVATREEVLALESLSPRDRTDRLLALRNKNNNAVLTVAVTYYTGKVDTVPHVPERCYVADGFQPGLFSPRDWALGTLANGESRTVPVRFIDFEDQTARGAQNRCVSYFFNANGKYMDDPNEVRVRLQALTERYAYFAKIEVMTLLPTRSGSAMTDAMKQKDRDGAEAAMKDFLAAALPKIEEILPDWEGRER